MAINDYGNSLHHTDSSVYPHISNSPQRVLQRQGYCVALNNPLTDEGKTQALSAPTDNLDLGNGITGETEYPSKDTLNRLRDYSIPGEKGLIDCKIK